MSAVLSLFLSAAIVGQPSAAVMVVLDVDCKPATAVLTVRLTAHGWRDIENGVKLPSKRPINAVDLVQMTAGENDDTFTCTTRSISRRCRLKGEVYTVRIAPSLAPRWHPVGYCAVRIGAQAIVLLKGKEIARAGSDACNEDLEITNEMTFRPGLKPVLNIVPAEQFLSVDF